MALNVLCQLSYVSMWWADTCCEVCDGYRVAHGPLSADRLSDRIRSILAFRNYPAMPDRFNNWVT